jgi:hypothetical protein
MSEPFYKVSYNGDLAKILLNKDTEYRMQNTGAFCPVVLTGSPHTLTSKRVLLPPLGPRAETPSPAEERKGVPIRTTGRRNSGALYTIIRVRTKIGSLDAFIDTVCINASGS